MSDNKYAIIGKRRSRKTQSVLWYLLLEMVKTGKNRIYNIEKLRKELKLWFLSVKKYVGFLTGIDEWGWYIELNGDDRLAVIFAEKSFEKFESMDYRQKQIAKLVLLHKLDRDEQ